VKLSNAEHETIISVNMEDDQAHIYTRIPKHRRHFERMGVNPYKTHKDLEGNEYAWDYSVPANWVRMPRGKAKRLMSEEHKRKSTEALAKARLARKPC